MKELPYFKFYCNEWITGDVTSLQLKEQGLFINLCAYYWSKGCNLSLSKAMLKFKNSSHLFDILIEWEVIKIIDGDIVISFLDEQLLEAGNISKINSKNGKLGGRPKSEIKAKKTDRFFSESETKANDKRSESETKAKKSNIEEKRREEKIEDKKIEEEIRKEKEEKKENPSSPIFKSIIKIEDLKTVCEKDEIWVSDICMKNRIDKLDLTKNLDDFVLFLKSEKCYEKTEKEFLQYFRNWIPQNIDRNKKNQSQKNECIEPKEKLIYIRPPLTGDSNF